MCSGISFLVGLLFLVRGSFQIGDRYIPMLTGRRIGLILMAPLIFSCLVFTPIAMNQPGQLSPDILSDPRVMTSAMMEIGALLLAIALATYLVLSVPPGVREQQRATATGPATYGKIMSTAEVATYLRIPEFEVITLIEDGKLPAARIGADYRVARSAVDDFLASGGASNT